MERRRPTSHATALGCAFAAAILAGCVFGSPPARADIDVRINIGDAPPAPRFLFHARPHERYDADEGMYLIDDPGVGDNDVFRYGGYYWVFYDGYWYRCVTWRGPFIVVHPRYVPARFYRMPPARWKHHPNGPPSGSMNRGGIPPGHVQRGGASPLPRAKPAAPMGRMKPGAGSPPAHLQRAAGGSPPAHAPQRSSPPPHMKQGGGAPPQSGATAGHQKKQGGGPPGQAGKAEKGDKGGDHGRK